MGCRESNRAPPGGPPARQMPSRRVASSRAASNRLPRNRKRGCCWEGTRKWSPDTGNGLRPAGSRKREAWALRAEARSGLQLARGLTRQPRGRGVKPLSGRRPLPATLTAGRGRRGSSSRLPAPRRAPEGFPQQSGSPRPPASCGAAPGCPGAPSLRRGPAPVARAERAPSLLRCRHRRRTHFRPRARPPWPPGFPLPVARNPDVPCARAQNGQLVS